MPPSRARERAAKVGRQQNPISVSVWWSKERPKKGESDPEIWRQVVGIVDQLSDEQQSRRAKAMRMQAVYEARDVDSLSLYSDSYSQLDSGQALELGVARNIIDSLNEEIAAKQRPKPRFVTTNADWKQRRKARWAERFIEAQLHQPQGAFSNTWELAEQVHHDCERWGVGLAKTYADPEQGKVVNERCFAFDFFVDDADAEYGDPKNLFHHYRYSKAELAERFPEHESSIMSAALPTDRRRVGKIGHGDMVLVREAWRKRVSRNVPGRHVIAIDGATLVDEEWDRDDFPVSILRWSRDPFGFWGTGLCQVLESMQAEMNAGYRSAQENLAIMGSGFIDAELEQYEEDDLQDNGPWKIMRRKPGTPPAVVQVPPPFNPAQLQFAQSIYDLSYELTGASRQGATSRKEAGIESAVAIQEVNDLNSRRHLSHARSYEQLFVQLGLKTMRAMHDLANEIGDDAIELQWPGRKFLTPISFSEIADLKEDMYEIQVQPASSLPSTPGARTERVMQLAGAGWIDPANAQRLISDTLDLQAYESRQNAQFEWVERSIDRMLDADEESYDPRIDKASPDPLMPNPGAAIVQVTDAYFLALADDAPDFNLDLLRTWIRDTDELVSRVEAEKQRQIETANAAQAAPPAPPGPAMAPGQPMMM